MRQASRGHIGTQVGVGKDRAQRVGPQRSMPHPGWAEHDADAVGGTTSSRLSGRSSTVASTQRILSIGTSAIGSCVLPIDADSRPPRPAILYGIDTRATAEIAALSAAWARHDLRDGRVGAFVTEPRGPRCSGSAILGPEIYNHTRYFLTSQAYLVYRLTGKPSIDVYTAGGFAPMWDIEARRWIPERGELMVPVDRLPEVFEL